MQHVELFVVVHWPVQGKNLIQLVNKIAMTSMHCRLEVDLTRDDGKSFKCGKNI
jgi:hypothetical protein